MQRDLLTLFLFCLIIFSTYNNGLNPSIPLLFLALYILAMIFRNNLRQKRIEFINQLKSHRNELRNGGAVVIDGIVLRYSSQITSYQIPVGGIVGHMDILTPYRKYKQGDNGEAIILSLTALATGWWAIPYGPITTCKAIYNNLKGGSKTTVAKLIDEKLLERLAFLKSLSETVNNQETKKTPPSVVNRDSKNKGNPPSTPTTTPNNILKSSAELIQKPIHSTIQHLKNQEKSTLIRKRVKYTSYQILSQKLHSSNND